MKWFRRILILLCLSIVVSMVLLRPNGHQAAMTERQHAQVRVHLDWANSECQRCLNSRLHELEEFFCERRARCQRFAEEVLSLRSKFTLASDYMPWSDGQAHANLVRVTFQEMVLSPQDICDRVNLIVSEFEHDIAATENELLVRIRTDLDRNSTTTGNADMNQALERSIAKLTQSLQSNAVGSTHQEVAGFVATTLLSEIMTPIVIEAMASAGIITAGGLSAPETLGIGLAVALVIDFGYSQIADPAGQLAGKLDSQLRDVQAQIIEGTKDCKGLKPHLLERLEAMRIDRERLVLSSLTR